MRSYWSNRPFIQRHEMKMKWIHANLMNSSAQLAVEIIYSNGVLNMSQGSLSALEILAQFLAAIKLIR